MPESKTYPNRLGLKGWLVGGKWGFERFMFFVHRITGLGLLLYFVMHIVVTSSRALGPEPWRRTMDRLSGGFFLVGEFLIFVAFAIHAANGIRLVLIELGILTGKAEEPVYPYKSSLNVQRPFLIVMMILAWLFIVLGGYDFLFLGH